MLSLWINIRSYSYKVKWIVGPPSKVTQKIIDASDYNDSDCGPRPDQYQSFGWFEQQGWKSKWPLHYAAMKGLINFISVATGIL